MARQKAQAPKRAAIYVRVSSERQAAEDRVSPRVQLEDCRTLAKQRGYVIVAEFSDVRKYRLRGRLVEPSGTRKDRPGYLELLRLARRGDIDVILAWKEDRLYRGLYAAVPLSEVLDERGDGLRVELVKEMFDRKMLGIKASIGKLEVDNIRERMIMGRSARLDESRVPGGPTRYGYRRSPDDQNIVDDDEAAIVRQIFHWYLDGIPLMEMRRRLNASGTPPRTGGVWSKATITKILYVGDFYAMGQYTTTLEGKTYTIACPPIINRDTWHRACERRKKNRVYPGRNVKEDYLCRGLVSCPCGWLWSARTVRRKGGLMTKAGYYACPRPAHQPDRVHPDCPKTIGSGKLDEFVWRYVKGLLLHPDALHRAIDVKLAELEAREGDLDGDIARAERRLEEMDDERQWIIRMGRLKQLTEKDMSVQLAELEFERFAVEKQLADLKVATAVHEKARALKKWADEYLAEISRGLAILDRDPGELDADSREDCFAELQADQYLDKYHGNRDKAFRWAHLEKRRKLVALLVKKVVVRLGKSRTRIIAPEVVVRIPIGEAEILSYGHQSLEYIERAKAAALGIV
jgi:DNA invertase Pin-like site-specific DNA recombinase